MLKKAVVALGMVLVLQSVFALCLVSALQLLVLRNTPFGVTGASPVVNAVVQPIPDNDRPPPSVWKGLCVCWYARWTGDRAGPCTARIFPVQ
ncbi:hypothetical protein [Streptomyces sp. AB3(2024)]|uniref:hypothetical protein n=1 Tax=Streptomyces sp. AB3(2024) TaxID=3317321 RepID=UPI0035A31A35